MNKREIIASFLCLTICVILLLGAVVILGQRSASMQVQINQLRSQIATMQPGTGGGAPAHTTAMVPPRLHKRHRSDPTPAQMQAGYSAVIHADVAASAFDPARNADIWAAGDATMINGKLYGTTGNPCYNHFEFLSQAAGAATFTVLKGAYGCDSFQQAPNNGSHYFWPSGVVYDSGKIWVFGNDVVGANPPVVGDSEVAEFSASTLAYEGITDLGIGNAIFSNPVPQPGGGFYLIATNNLCAPGQVTDCFEGDVYAIQSGGEPFPASWDPTIGVFPVTLNAGAIISATQTSTGWLAFTKQGDAFGGNSIEELSAPSMTGPWTVTGKTWPTNPPAGDYSYSVELHPGQGQPAGEDLLTYAMNGNQADYYPRFVDVTP